MAIEKLVVVSDLHVGSTVGLLHPHFTTLQGIGIVQNGVQKRLWAVWKDLWDNWIPKTVGGSEFAVVINGDLIDGVHHKSVEVISPDVSDHVRAAHQCMVPITRAGAKHIFITEGTESHTRNTETTLGEIIGAEQDPISGRYAFPRLDLEVQATNCTFFHHTSTTSRSYLEASALSIFLGNERAEAARSDLPIPQVLGMAHRHRHGMFSDGEGVAFTTGAWQALTRYGYRVVPAAIPTPSCVVLDWTVRGSGVVPVVHEKTYRPDTHREAISI